MRNMLVILALGFALVTATGVAAVMYPQTAVADGNGCNGC
jgi:hypothetical protein